MSVEFDAAAKSTIKLLNNFGKFNAEYLAQIDKEIKGKGKGGANIIEQHFQKSPPAFLVVSLSFSLLHALTNG